MNKLHYPGDCREFIPHRVIGPDLHGAWYRPLSAHYFNGITTIFYRPVPPAELPEELREMSSKVVAVQDVWKGWKIWHGRAAGRLPATRWSSSLGAYLISRQRKSPVSHTGTQNRKSQRELRKRFKKLH